MELDKDPSATNQQQQQQQQQEQPSRAEIAAVNAAIASSDPRDKILALFSGITSPLPPTWNLQTDIRGWSSRQHSPGSPYYAILRDESGDVTHIIWQNSRATGRISSYAMSKLDQILPQLFFLDLTDHLMSGHVDFAHLPPKLRGLELRTARKDTKTKALTGTPFAKGVKWPAQMRSINLANNDFSGGVDWRALSKLELLETLFLAANKFTGSVKFKYLPARLRQFSIESNRFSGAADLSLLHRHSVSKLFVRDNADLKLVASLDKFPLSLDRYTLSRMDDVIVTEKTTGEMMTGDHFFQRAVDAAVDKAAKSPDERLKVLLLFLGVTEGVPASWKLEEGSPIESWKGVKLDEAGRHVVEIVAQGTRMKGDLNTRGMKRLLPHLRVLNLRKHLLQGSFLFDQLPATLEVLDITSAREQPNEPAFVGPLVPETTSTPDSSAAAAAPILLPPALRVLNVGRNHFSGSLASLKRLFAPLQTLEVLWLDGNKRLGTNGASAAAASAAADLLQIFPRGLKKLSIADCGFENVALDLSELPASIVSLSLHGNSNSVRFYASSTRKFPLGLDKKSILNLQKISIALGNANGHQLRGDDFYSLVRQANQ